ncbi:MAG TPA: ThuA domain-containing protein [Candidatus Eisenbacteria bacterium]|nr:ThuA domain-containing protein [Candidatus Eisenbacteria bacterium]
MSRGLLGLAAAAALGLATCVARAPDAAPGGGTPSLRVLVFSRTLGFRHDSIPDGVAALEALGREHGFGVDSTEDAGRFTPSNLARYRVVVFLSTTGEVLQGAERDALRGFVRGGGGFVGVHSAADTLYDWPWYGALVGAYFARHPAVQPAALRVEDASHPSTRGLPDPWTWTDEWYDFRASPRPEVHVLLAVDESSYHGGGMGADHPVAWYHAYDGGRAWYTALGHVREAYRDPAFRAHLLGGIAYAAGGAWPS